MAISARCGSCPFFDPQGDGTTGICRQKPPTIVPFEVAPPVDLKGANASHAYFPVVSAKLDWCSEHPTIRRMSHT